MEAYFNFIFKGMSYKIFQFSKVRHYLDTSTWVLVYINKRSCRLRNMLDFYCIYRKHDADKLQKLQNQALQMCFNIYNPRDISTVASHSQS